MKREGELDTYKQRHLFGKDETKDATTAKQKHSLNPVLNHALLYVKNSTTRRPCGPALSHQKAKPRYILVGYSIACQTSVPASCLAWMLATSFFTSTDQAHNLPRSKMIFLFQTRLHLSMR